MKPFILLVAFLASLSASAETSDDDVSIAVECGTLVGRGTILIVDKSIPKVYRLPFACNVSSS